MSRYFIKGTNKEIKLGEIIKVCINNGVNYQEYTFNFSSSDYIFLNSIDLVEKREDKESTDILAEVISRLSNKFGVTSTEFVHNWLPCFENINLSTTFSMLLKEVAIVIDERYKDHISNSDRIFVISMIDGRIVEAPKKLIKSYKNFAAFRTLDDAREACRILRPYLKKMFKNE